jgi:hypothetical protein
MVTLRIWYPSRANGFGPGSCSLAIAGEWGAGYISTRPVKHDPTRPRDTATATLIDDLQAEGGETRHMWLFHRLDENRMLRLWNTLQSGVPATWKTANSEASFHMCDMILATGRGIDVEEDPGVSFDARATGTIELATLANSGAEMAAHASHYLKIEHW